MDELVTKGISVTKAVFGFLFLRAWWELSMFKSEFKE